MDLIDREALLESMAENGIWQGDEIEAIKSAPTVDAVEVVRCKYCKRSYIYKPKNEGMVYCAIHGMSKNGNGFCEEGVPKDVD